MAYPRAVTRPTCILDVDLKITTFEPPGKHSATVILLHGLGGEANNLYAGVDVLREELSPQIANGVKFVLPQAPMMRVTGNRGAVMPSWFDCYSFDIENRREDEEGLLRSASWLDALIDREVNEFNIPPGRIVVGGISQGGAVSFRALLNTGRKIGGVFILSSYVPLRRKVQEIKTPLASSIPIFWGHGTVDPQVEYPFSLRCARQLAADLGIGFVQRSSPFAANELKNEGSVSDGVKLSFCSYPGLGHWYSNEEIADMAKWVEGVLA